MIKEDIYNNLKVHNDDVYTYVNKRNYVTVHAYYNGYLYFSCRYSFYTDRIEFRAQPPSSYQV